MDKRAAIVLLLTAASLAALALAWPLLFPDGQGRQQSFEYRPRSIKNVSPEVYQQHRPHLRRLKLYVTDPFVGHLRRPSFSNTNRWREHPEGRIESRTNSLGFREDQELAPVKPPNEVRILITGDSHTDGVVWNSESFANVLEARLQTASDGIAYNVINGGVGLFGPYNYPRFLIHHAGLEPDLYIVTFFLGNDFSDAARLLEAALGPLQRPKGYRHKLKQCRKKGVVVSQSINQAYYFKIFPFMLDPALAFTMEQLEDVEEFCAAHGIELLVLLLPSRLGVEREALHDKIEIARRILDLDDADLEIERRLAERLGTLLARAGIEHLDLYRHLLGQPQSLYWEIDHHLNVDGHRRVAEVLYDLYRDRFAALAADRRRG